MKFTKIKRSKDGQVLLRWTTDSPPDMIRHELESADLPEPEFAATLQGLADDMLQILELPAEYGEGMRVVGVTLTSGEDGRRGAVITALRELTTSAAPAVFNTPHLREEDAEDPNPCLPGRTLSQIEYLEALAERYVNGKRSQGDLFEDETPAAAFERLGILAPDARELVGAPS